MPDRRLSNGINFVYAVWKILPGGICALPAGQTYREIVPFICKLHRRYHSTRKQSIPPDIVFFQEEIKRLRTANCIMKQYIRKKRLIPPFYKVPDDSLRFSLRCPSPENTSLPADLEIHDSSVYLHG